jgi:hypothetical protein
LIYIGLFKAKAYIHRGVQTHAYGEILGVVAGTVADMLLDALG